MLEFWYNLSDINRTILIIGAVAGGLGILYAFARYQVDFSGFGEWIKSLLGK